MPSSVTAQQVIDLVRVEHPAFSQAVAPDGALLAVLDTRQRRLLLLYGGAVDGLVSTTVELATTFSGVLVGKSAGGTPVYGTTYADGWPLHQSAGGTPYVNFAEPAIAGDPFGEHGGVPGFPLPTDFVKLIQVVAVLSDNQMRPVDVIPESARLSATRSGRPTAFVSGNRLVPVRPYAANNSGDIWSIGIANVQLSYVALPVLTSLTDAITVPAVLVQALVAQLAAYLAGLAPGVTGAERQSFRATALAMEQSIGETSVDVVGAASTHSVRYRG